MSQGDELILDRRRHLDALGELGVPAYPNRFARTDSITALVEAHGGKSAEALESPRIETTAGGRILAIRSFGKANFLVLSDGVNRIQAYIRQDSCPRATSRSSSCSTLAITSASRGTCSAHARAS